MEFIPFVFAAVSLLTIPGPTNALLAASGGAVGILQSIPLLMAALVGYLASVIALRAGLGPLIASTPLAAIVVRAAFIVYLIHLARLLWRHRSSGSLNPVPVSFKSVLATTFLNPKALVLALVLLPQDRAGLEMLPWFAAMAALITAIGFAWIAMGTVLERGLRTTGHPELVPRISACVLVVMAAAMCVQNFAMV